MSDVCFRQVLLVCSHPCNEGMCAVAVCEAHGAHVKRRLYAGPDSDDALRRLRQRAAKAKSDAKKVGYREPDARVLLYAVSVASFI